ncbi:MAG: MXAN_6640 family putative metalloprotease [Limisphaerales bacterium]
MSLRGLLGWLFVLLLTTSTAKAATTLDKIDEAQVQGRLSADHAILLKVQALKGAKTLPKEYLPDQSMPERCGTRVTSEAIENWESYSPRTQAVLQQALARPVQQKSLVSPDSFFMIHYDTAGPHAVPVEDEDLSGVPDYAENLARYADSSLRTEVLQMGYFAPPPDGDGRYDVYTQNLGTGLYGYTQPESPGPAPWTDYTSFIVVHHTLIGFPPNNDPESPQKGAMKVTIAHEFHHAIQFAYNASTSGRIWFMEITSTWMEDVVFDLVDDNYNYLPIFFTQPQTPLTNTGIHMYSSFIWNQYLAQNFGPDIIRQIWQENISFTASPALDRVLQTRSTTLGREFSRFALWNFYTGGRDDGQHYEEGGFYPEMALHQNSGGLLISGRSQSIPALAAQYETFPSGDTIEKARLTFTGRTSGVWGAHVLFHNPPTLRAYPFNLVANNQGDTTFFGLDSFPRVVLIGAQIKTAQLTVSEYFDYSYKAFPFYIPGDLNEDLAVTVEDVVYLSNWIFLEIPPPENYLEAADLNCNGALGPADLVLLLNFVFLALSPSC